MKKQVTWLKVTLNRYFSQRKYTNGQAYEKMLKSFITRSTNQKPSEISPHTHEHAHSDKKQKKKVKARQ